jgi:phage shock protein A
MIKLFRRMGKYMTALFTGKFNEHADPKIQLEQAIMEAQEQHRRLTEQAANVIANQKQTEMRLNRGMEELETTTGRARQALLMADDARKKGDEKKAGELERTAEILATKLIQVEKEVESLKNLHLQNSENADNAKRAVQANATQLQKKLAERQKLLSQLDQAKMQEQMNTAMASLNAQVGQDVPTLEEVRTKIEARYAKALGTSELQGDSVETRMLEVEQASVDFEAQGRLSELRTQLGLSSPGAAAEVGPAGTAATEVTGNVPEGAEVPRPGAV